MKLIKEPALSFDDITLIPQKSNISSRYSNEIDLTQQFGKDEVKLPIINAPMDKVVSYDLCKSLVENGGIALLHRFMTAEQQVELYKSLHYGIGKQQGEENYLVGLAIGTRDWEKRVHDSYILGCRLYCIDVAHGHHENVMSLSRQLKEKYEDIILIAGNVCTKEAYIDLVQSGVDIVRISVGGGKACSTKKKTGHGLPTLQAVIDCNEARREYGGIILADGGLRDGDDIAKSLAAGANYVMLGSMLASTSLSPGDVVNVNGQPCKLYRGMFSYDAQKDYYGNVKTTEGESGFIPYMGQTEDRLLSLSQQMVSALSYSGCRSIEEFQEKSVARVITVHGEQEGRAKLL